MHPVLFEAGTFRLHTFGVLVALGFIAGLAWSVLEAKRAGVDKLRVMDLCFTLLLWGLLGARALYVAVNWEQFGGVLDDAIFEHGHFWGFGIWLVHALALWEGGLVWYGGMLVALVAGLRYAAKHQMPKWETADLVAPGVMLGLAIGRLGCLAAGDDYGKLAEGAWETVKAGGQAPWWTITFTDNRSLVPDALLGKPLYPSQILMSLTGLAMFGLLVVLRRAQRFPGMVVWVMVLGYSALRFLVEFSRGDTARGVYWDGVLSTSQIIALAAVPVSIFMLRRLSKTGGSPTDQEVEDGSKAHESNTGKGTSA